GAFVFVGFCVVLGVTLLPKINWSLQPSVHGADHLAAWVLGTSVIFALVASWFSFASDYSRYLPERLSERSVAGWIAAGTAASMFLFGALGVLVASIDPNRGGDLLALVSDSPPLAAVVAWLIGLAVAVPFVDSRLRQSPLAVNLLHNTDISGYVGAVTGAAVYLALGRR